MKTFKGQRAVAVVFFMTVAAAGSPEPPRAAPGKPAPLTFNECAILASERHPDLGAARETLESIEAQRKAARASFLPQVSASLGYTQGSSAQPSGSSVLSDRENGLGAYSATLSATQNLFSGFADRSKAEQARANSRAASANVAQVKARISVELKTAFSGLSYAIKSDVVSEEILKRRQRNLDLVQLRYENGRENRGSVLLSKAYLGQANLERLQARNALITAEAQLAKVVGAEPGEGLNIQGEVPPPNLPPELTATSDLTKLLDEVPEVRASKAQAEASAAAVGVARGALYPSLNLTASLGKQDTTWFPENDRWSAGLTLSMPLFTGGRNYFGLQAAQATYSASKATSESTRRQVIVKIRQTYGAYQEAVAREKADRAFLEAAEVRAEVARIKYNNGLLSFEDWDLIENDLINRERAALQSQRDRVIAEANLEQSLGRGAIQ